MPHTNHHFVVVAETPHCVLLTFLLQILGKCVLCIDLHVARERNGDRMLKRKKEENATENRVGVREIATPMFSSMCV